jgi:NAD+ synthetase
LRYEAAVLAKNQPGRLASPALHPDLAGALQALRRRRGFDVERCIEAKTALLNAYLTASGLQACVVGVSGGVDSAVTLGLACRAAAQPGSPIRKVVAALLPMFVSEGATNQDTALSRGREVADRFGARCLTVDLSSGHGAVKGAVDAALGITGGPWASGQLVSYLRTPALYYLASLLTQQGSPSLLLGTTNRDEGAYIGFFGKASDGMVDIQLISDLHKSEVYAVARHLGVPASVIDATPTGDVFDGRTDEEMIGASYDFIELYTLYLTLDSDAARSRLEERWSEEARRQFQELRARLEALHGYNAHKYLGGSPAIHLDAHERAVPGGWRRDAEPVAPALGPRAAWVGEFTLAPLTLDRLDPRRAIAPRLEPIQDFGDSAFLVHDLLAPDECTALRAALAAQSWVPVGQNGMVRGFDPSRDVTGSHRATSFEPRVADLLWERLAGRIPMLRTMRDDTPTDWQGSRVWRAVGINPLLRFIVYRRGGLLVPHYDAPYEAPDGRRTLMSVLVYLSDAKGEADRGATRLLVDPQRNRPLSERDYTDWPSPEPSNSPRVLFRVPPRKGSTLILDHRVLHDARAHEGDSPKILLRTDILFGPCGIRAGKPIAISVPAPRLPLWEKLGLDPGASRAQVDAAYRRLPPAERAQPESRLAWKVLRDPFYASAYPHLLTEAKLERAGFFDDRASIEADNSRRLHPSWLVTPVHKIIERLHRSATTEPAGQDRRLVVLVSTGAFCPVHSGHLEMMELARCELTRRGDLVLGGYLSPSHDAYVSIKCGARTLSAAHRVSLCEDAVRESDWLMADRWEACENDGELNFTDVLYRLEEYLGAHVPCHRPIEIVYVFGGDNARFVRTFLERGACVCINRPGYEDRVSEVRADPIIARNPAIVFVDESTEAPGISSSSARLGDYTHLDERVRATFQAWSEKQEASSAPPRSAIFHLRDEGTFSILPWAASRDLTHLEALRRGFLDKLASLISSELLAASAPDVPLAVEVRLLDLAEQRRSAAERTAGKRVLSLDACIPGDFDLGLSRGFPLSGGKEPSRIVARPGFAPLAEQLEAIPAGEYTLLDDDTVTGATIQRVLALLPEKLRIQGVVILFEMATLDEAHAPSLDIGDCRDFLVGSRDGGLVVSLPSGATARAPYVLPYVSPAERASLPLSREVAFSIAIWTLNEAFFQQVSPPLLLRHADPAFQLLMSHVGFAPDATMEFICQWHLARLQPS